MKKDARIGWVLDSSSRRTFPLPWDRMSVVAQIRYLGIARHLDRTSSLAMERYLPWRRYDAVVFVKVMSPSALRLAETLKKRGTKVLFDANVNYYERWGDFAVPGTAPTDVQRRQAVTMTQMADGVVADSNALLDRIRPLNANSVWIADAVDLARYTRRTPRTPPAGRLRLAWSGMAKKAYHLEIIEPVLLRLRERLELLLVPGAPAHNDPPAEVLTRLQAWPGTRIAYFDDDGYPGLLETCDVIISPKDLSSSYEQTHTEYKITLGMAMELPALASAQPSYVEAIGNGAGGVICRTPDDWEKALTALLESPSLLEAQGRAARQKVETNYSIAPLAARYEAFIRQVLNRR